MDGRAHVEDVQLKSFLLMLNEETKKSMDWLKDRFDTVDEKIFLKWI